MTSPLSKSQLDAQKQLLVSQHDELESEIANGQHDHGEAYTSVAGEVQDSGDQSVANTLSGIESTVANHQAHELEAVNNALLRIENGLYGLCIECQEPIDIKRLQAFPAAKRCIDCKQAFENRQATQPNLH